MASKGKFSESNRQSLFEIQRGQTVSGVEARIIHAAGKRIHQLTAEVAAVKRTYQAEVRDLLELRREEIARLEAEVEEAREDKESAVALYGQAKRKK